MRVKYSSYIYQISKLNIQVKCVSQKHKANIQVKYAK